MLSPSRAEILGEGAVEVRRFELKELATMRLLMLLLAMMQAEVESPRPGVEYQIFQFPANQIPRIDGDAGDWSIVPDSYSIGTDQLVDTVGKHGDKRDPDNLDVNVK
ncbi:MAG: hypothetical protein DWH78_15480, partial [Planctomycetota bacterium]